MTMLQNEGDRAILAGFFNQWQPALDFVNNRISARGKLNTIYNIQPTDLLGSLATQNIDVINTALANQPGITLQDYANKVTASGILGATAVGGVSSVSDELSLAEHHIYGSSRLGVRYYDQVVNTWKNKWVYNNPGQSFWNLNAPNVWYSYNYGDLVKKDQRLPWNNWHDRTNSSSNNNGNSTYFVTNRTLGMTQYELADHLGNVLATILDRKVGHVSSGNSSLYDYYVADIASAQDYYPGGMMMPGRSMQAGIGLLNKNGYNGKRNDNEVYGQGNFQDYGMRGFDPRLIRF